MNMAPWSRSVRYVVPALAVLGLAATLGPLGATRQPSGPDPASPVPPAGPEQVEQVLRGRRLVLTHGCGGCHGGYANPASDQWLAGGGDSIPMGEFFAWPRNLTPDPETGLGRFSERQIFNALRFGLRPSATPDVEITSAVPGEGNHPASPDYLSPAMPWLHWRHMPDPDLWDIAAYLKHGLRPVRHEIRDSEGPPDRWAGTFAVEKIGHHILPPFPAAREQEPAPEKRDQVVRGRLLVTARACGVCHGGGRPDRDGWLAGLSGENQAADPYCAYCVQFPIGPFQTRARNLTPDNTTGIGRFSERQIFNALRYGLRPGETADVEITSTRPGEGNHPISPKYLAPPMPWPEWRHMTDRELWDIAAYLKHGVKPVGNRVEDSDGPPDFWLSEYTVEKYGTWPAPPFPTAREKRPD